MELDFEVARRGIDPAAETCEHALRDLLGIALTGLVRSELWRFDVGPVAGAETAELRARIAAAASRAGRYLNLNRDRAGWLDGPHPYPREAPAAGCAVDLWVRDGDGTDQRALLYFRAQAQAGMVQVWRGTLWRLILPVADPAAARREALEIAVTRDRRHGLLANPHAQTAVVLHVVPAPAAKEKV
jgi:hypothetical protein